MKPGHILALLGGAFLTAAFAILVGQAQGPAFAGKLDRKAARAIARAGGRGVEAHFFTSQGWATRHATLSGGDGLDDATRTRTALAVWSVPGVGSVHWSGGSRLFANAKKPPRPLHCQKDVEALLRARTIRFKEGSATIDPASRPLVDEVEMALRPCLGSIIAITGHTDSSGNEPGNLALSRERAEAVRLALIARGIPADGLRASGVGSRQPVAGLDSSDPANRRIEFSVIATEPIRPIPVDMPGPR